MSLTGVIHVHCEQLSGAAAKGSARISVDTADQQVRDPVGNIVFSGPLTVTLINGEATVTVPASDDPTLSPTGFSYTVQEQLTHVSKSDYRSASFLVPAGLTVHTADVASSEEVAGDPSYGASLNGALAEIAALRDLSDTAFTADLSDAFSRGIDPRSAGAAGNGTTDDSAVIQALIDAGQKIWVPPGVTFLANLVAKDGMVIESGTPSGVGGVGRGTLRAKPGAPLFTTPSSGTAFATGCQIRNVWLESTTTGGGGDLIAGKWAIGAFQGVSFVQYNAAKSVINVTGWVDMSMTAGCSVAHVPSASVPTVKMLDSTNNLVHMRFGDTRFTTAGGSYVIHIEGTNGATPSMIDLSNVNFEGPIAGAVKLLSCRNVKLGRVGIWDTASAISAHVFHIGKSATSGAAPRNIVFEQCWRDASASGLGGGVYDIYVDSAAGMTGLHMDQVGHQTGGAYKVDAGTSTGTLRGTGVTVLDNAAKISTDAYQAYTPTLTGTGTTQGNATCTGEFKRHGDHIEFFAMIILGSTTVIGSQILVSAPAEFASGVSHAALTTFITDTGTANYHAPGEVSGDHLKVHVLTIGTGGSIGYAGSTSPHTWAAGDVIEVRGVYKPVAA